MDYPVIIRKIVTRVAGKVGQMSGIDLEYKASERKWSKKEILGHLIDSAYNNHQRIVKAVKQNDLIFQGYDQDEWVIRNRYQCRDVGELVMLWKMSNDHLAHAINALPAGFLDKKFDKHNLQQIGIGWLPASGSATLSYLVWDYIHHMEGHLQQIIPGYKRTNPPIAENAPENKPEKVPWLAFR